MGLYHEYRPATLDDVIGQESAVKTLAGLMKKGVPHALLFAGPSGCGKTTMARIVADQLNCHPSHLTEMNAADFRGIDAVRDIRSASRLSPMAGGSRVFLIDECHKLTNDAQNAMLKLLEDPPKHVYFLLCTTEPNKLIATVRNRCTTIAVQGVKRPVLKTLIQRTAKAEKRKVFDEAVDKILDLAEGSPRKSLVLLEQALTAEDEDGQVDAVVKTETSAQAIDIARSLFDPSGKTGWAEVAKKIKEVEDEPETVRRVILGYASNVLLGGGKMAGRAYEVIQVFRDHWYDCGKAGMVASCYELLKR